MKYILLILLASCNQNFEYRVNTEEGVVICTEMLTDIELADCTNKKTGEHFPYIRVSKSATIFKKRK